MQMFFMYINRDRGSEDNFENLQKNGSRYSECIMFTHRHNDKDPTKAKNNCYHKHDG